jgi:hypothetical protein
MIGALEVDASNLIILTFLMIFVHREMPSFYLGKSTSREICPIDLKEGWCKIYTFGFSGNPGYFTNSISPGFQVLSNPVLSGPQNECDLELFGEGYGRLPRCIRRDFDQYLCAFHRLRLNGHLALKQVDPFLHTANAHPFCRN